jgi:hypothetical protein
MFLGSYIADAKFMEPGYQPAFASGGQRAPSTSRWFDVNTDSNEHDEQSKPESPIMMCAPPVRSLTMDMVTLAVRMQMFRIVHGHPRLRIKSRVGCHPVGENHGLSFSRRRLSRPKRRSTKGRPCVPRPAANRAAGRSEYGDGLRIHE